MNMDLNIDIDYLNDCLKITPEERLIRCAEFWEFCSEFNQHYLFELENNNPDIFRLMWASLIKIKE